MLFNLSNLNSNLALTLGYLNPALNNLALEGKSGPLASGNFCEIGDFGENGKIWQKWRIWHKWRYPECGRYSNWMPSGPLKLND